MNTILLCPTLVSYLNSCRHPKGTHTHREREILGKKEWNRVKKLQERERERMKERKAAGEWWRVRNLFWWWGGEKKENCLQFLFKQQLGLTKKSSDLLKTYSAFFLSRKDPNNKNFFFSFFFLPLQRFYRTLWFY